MREIPITSIPMSDWISLASRAINLRHYISVEINVAAKTIKFQPAPGGGPALILSGPEAKVAFQSLTEAGLFQNITFPAPGE